MANDIDIMLENEARRVEKAIAQRNQMLDGMDKERFRVLPMRYILEFPFDPFTDGTNQIDISRSFVVRQQSKHFACRALVQSLIVVGTPVVGGDSVRFTLAPQYMAVMQYRFSLRDSYTDRAWSNVALPGSVISQSALQETVFARPARIPAGAQVEMNVSVLAARSLITGLDEVLITKFVLQIAFVGDEVVRVAA